MGILNNELWWAIGIAVVLGGTVAFLLLRDKKGPSAQTPLAPGAQEIGVEAQLADGRIVTA